MQTVAAGGDQLSWCKTKAAIAGKANSLVERACRDERKEAVEQGHVSIVSPPLRKRKLIPSASPQRVRPRALSTMPT